MAAIQGHRVGDRCHYFIKWGIRSVILMSNFLHKNCGDAKGDHATISTDASKELLCSMYSNQFLRIWDRLFTSDDLLGNQARGWRRTLEFLTFMAGCVWSSCTFKLIQCVLVVSVIILEWRWREREGETAIDRSLIPVRQPRSVHRFKESALHESSSSIGSVDFLYRNRNPNNTISLVLITKKFRDFSAYEDM